MRKHQFKVSSSTFFWPLIICFLGIPLSLHLYGLGVILFFLFLLQYKLNPENKGFWFYQNTPAKVLIILYLLYIIGLLYSTNIRGGIFTLEKMLSIALLPIALASLPPLPKKLHIKAFAFYSILIGLVCLVIWLWNFWHFYTLNEVKSFSLISRFWETHHREQLSKARFIYIHHPYFGLLIATSILIIINYFHSLSNKGFFIFLGSWLFIFLIQLQAKMSLVGLVVSVFVLGFISLNNKSGKSSFILVLVVLITSFALIPLKKDHLITAVNRVAYADGGSRIRNWESAVEAIKNAPFFGYGTGDSVDALQSYRQKGSWEHQEKYNAHNQYLDITLRFGVAGLAYWLFLLGYMFWKAYKTKQYFFAQFILLFALCSLTEVLLARFHGVALFALLLSIFANQHGKTLKNDYSKAGKTTAAVKQ